MPQSTQGSLFPLAGAAAGGAIGGVPGAALGMGLGSTLGGMFGGGDAAAAADPFASQRGQYQGQLSRLMSDPNYIFSDPSYQFRFKGGMDALSRGEAKGGMFGSGNMGYDLINYGQGFASTEFQNEEQRLAQLAGATIGSPGMAGQLKYQGMQDMFGMAAHAGQGLYDYYHGTSGAPGTTSYAGDSMIPSIADGWSPQFGGGGGGGDSIASGWSPQFGGGANG